jgi:glycosyltransferase involved in cell wall biosynthesis/peptidoglycan/xylan/chitin deacetylase (PgdA/CDA1 family)
VSAGRRLAIVHVVDSLAGSGGAENRLVDEVVALRDRFDQVVVRLFERDHLQGRLEAAGVPVVALGFRSARAGRSWPVVARRLRSVLRERRPDVVHTSLFTANLVGQLASRPLGIPVLSTFNRTGDLALQRALQPGVAGWRGRSMQAIARRVARQGDVHYRAVSGYVRDGSCQLMGLPPEDVTVIPRGIAVDPAAIDPSRARFGLPENGPLFVNVARLVPEKAQHLLIEAFARVVEELPDAHLAIAGATGSAEPVVRAAIERHRLDGRVHLLGYRADARDLVAAADGFAFSSVSEGLPGAVLEALALGTPVVAFDIAPVVELTDGGRVARLAPSGSVDGLAQAMIAAYRSPDSDGEAAAARAWAARFDVDTIAGRLGDLLEDRARAREARGVAVISIDTELAWGEAHHRDGPPRREYGDERRVIDRLLTVFERYEIPATWAVVGHLFLDRCSRDGADGRPHPEVLRPEYPWLEGDWFDVDPCADRAAAPDFYGPDIVERIKACAVAQEIGCHSFAHAMVGEPGYRSAVFESDLAACRAAADAHGIDLRSFVFPRNSVGHVEVLGTQGFTSYRGRARKRVVRPRREASGVWNIPATYLYAPATRRRNVPIGLWALVPRMRLRQAARDRSLFHLWFHPYNITDDPERALRGIELISREAARLRERGRLDVLTMGGLAERLDALAQPTSMRSTSPPPGQVPQFDT